MRTIFFAALVAVAGCTPAPSTAPPAGQPILKPAAQAPKDPWPECAAVRAYLKDHASDPASVEIVKWEERRVIQPDPRFGHELSYNLLVLYRGKNQYGGKTVQRTLYYVSGAKVTGSSDLDAKEP
jgi:hypothetical protein